MALVDRFGFGDLVNWTCYPASCGLRGQGFQAPLPTRQIVASEVDWDLARRVAGRVSGREHFSRIEQLASLEADFEALTVQAEGLVAAETGLLSLAGSAKARVTSREGWVDVNLAAFDRLLRPLLNKFDSEESEKGRISQAMAPFLAPISAAVGPKVAATEMGALLGWMSGRVLGQYDLLVIEEEKPEDQDWVYYVGQNILNLERRYGFPAREFRLWIALHECTHRAQFTGVPWLRPYFLSLVTELMDAVDPDPKHLLETIRQTVMDKRNGVISDAGTGGLGTLFATAEQRETLAKMTGLMSLLEGHGDITMDRAGKDLIPSQPRFARVLSARRRNASGPTKFFQKLIGMEAKLAQYEEGESFVKAVEASGGPDLFARVWEGPEMLPNIAEVREPKLWIERVAGVTASA